MHLYRTHTCGDLTKKEIGIEVKLSGWVHRRRDHGKLMFIDLRDHYGITQCVLDNEILDLISNLRFETVITIIGKVVERSEDTINNNISTGEIEVQVSSYILESQADILPLQVNNDSDFPEETRLKYRFLDLRREKLHDNIVLRSKIISHLRKKMTEQGFNEFQTPILTASSPEGARDYLVPSRIHAGKFYALPQAPQIFKQLIMVAGFDKYFQIAPCFRDEDARADRSPGEFYQLDIEMSFVTQEDIFNTIEPVLYSTFKEFSNNDVTNYPFPRITYDDAMLKYGCDKPDLRINLIISDVTEIFKDSNFSIFSDNIKRGKIIRAIPSPNCADKPRSFFDKMIEYAQSEGAAGLAYIIFDFDGTAKGPVAKFLTEEKLNNIKKVASVNNGDAVFFSCDKEQKAAKIAGLVRIKLGKELDIIEKNIYKFCWVTDFPFYELNEITPGTSVIDFSHNPFSMPQGGIDVLNNAKTEKDLLDIRAYQYDIVCNGIELSSGAIRNHKPELMYRAFEIVGYNREEVDRKFCSLINAFKFGAPPHGGIAPGIDRIVMLIADEPNIREVICFPMNQQAQDLMMGAPTEVSDKQLKELHININKTSLKVSYDK